MLFGLRMDSGNCGGDIVVIKGFGVANNKGFPLEEKWQNGIFYLFMCTY